MFSRLIAGTRVAMFVGLASIFFAVLIGVALGAIAGYFAGFADTLVMRIADVFLAFPLMIGAVVIILVTGRGITPVIISLAVFSWATVSRLLRSSILSVREMDYVHAAKALGASGGRIVRTHILPNSLTPVLVYATFNVGTTIIGVAALSFLGAGVPVDVPEWGNMLAAGQASSASTTTCGCTPASSSSSPCSASPSSATACVTRSTRSCGRAARCSETTSASRTKVAA